jgi:hypothetical protein
VNFPETNIKEKKTKKHRNNHTAFVNKTILFKNRSTLLPSIEMEKDVSFWLADACVTEANNLNGDLYDHEALGRLEKQH